MAKQTLIFGAIVKPILPQQERSQRVHDYQKLIDKLKNKTHLSIKFRAYDSHEALSTALLSHEADIIYYCHPDLRLLQDQRIIPLVVVTTEENGKKVDYYNSYIISKKQALTSLASLKNTVLGLDNEGISLSATIYPLNYFYQHHIDPNKYFSKIIYYHSGVDRLNALDKGNIEVTAVWEDVYNVVSKKNKYNVIAKLTHLPNPPIVVASNVSLEYRQILEKAFLSLPASAFQGLTFNGVEAYHPGFYDEGIGLIDKYHNK